MLLSDARILLVCMSMIRFTTFAFHGGQHSFGKHCTRYICGAVSSIDNTGRLKSDCAIGLSSKSSISSSYIPFTHECLPDETFYVLDGTSMLFQAYFRYSTHY